MGSLRQCLVMLAGGVLVVGFLLVAGVPGSLLLGLAPVAVCVGMHVLMGHDHGHGEHIAETARRSVASEDR